VRSLDVRVLLVRSVVATAAAGLGLMACSSAGSKPDTAKVERPTSLQEVRSRLDAAGFSCGGREPGEVDRGLGGPTATDQMVCEYRGVSTQVSLYASDGEVRTVLARLRSFGLCDQDRRPITYVDGGRWVAFSDVISTGATSPSAHEVSARVEAVNRRIAQRTDATLETHHDC
jgi:hypothetical protein